MSMTAQLTLSDGGNPVNSRLSPALSAPPGGLSRPTEGYKTVMRQRWSLACLALSAPTERLTGPGFPNSPVVRYSRA